VMGRIEIGENENFHGSHREIRRGRPWQQGGWGH
jgi:hypothetical protein